MHLSSFKITRGKATFTFDVDAGEQEDLIDATQIGSQYRTRAVAMMLFGCSKAIATPADVAIADGSLKDGKDG